VEDLARRLELDGPDAATIHLLGQTLQSPEKGRLDLTMEIVTDRVVVDTDYCAREDYNTGVQRVVRQVLPRWLRDHEIVAVAHIDERTAYRALAPREMARVFSHNRDVEIDLDAERRFAHRLVVPWETTVLWPEVSHPDAGRRLAGLAQYSGNEVGLVAYDMIPINSTHLRPFGEAGEFGQYLNAVKHADRVAGISNSATTEFSGFAHMLSAQGLAGPKVVEVELAEDVGDHFGAGRSGPPPGRPVVLMTARRELHKNLRACLHAAQRLWNEGMDFEVVMMGGSGWAEGPIQKAVDRLQSEGHPLTTLGWIPDGEMWQLIRDASFVVFTSLHEGYGLPVAEALACGTPVITTNYGSQAEIGLKGGCLLVDPRSDSEITAAMRALITDPAHLTRLRKEISVRPRRSWDDYARELWAFLVDGREPARVAD
jgi:glycosyltransferase involved in cell wall biosynthesis